MRVTKQDSDHSQTWDPFDEVQVLVNATAKRLRNKEVSEASREDVSVVRAELERGYGFSCRGREPIKNV